ncbi:MAG: RIP metalloprotease RseP [bacterium]|nr:RIP metalloprotease RseP [bacterium]
MLTIFIFILILGLLVFVHELGHFLLAKKFGMRVEEFGFGFPPRLFEAKRGETVYSINLIPLGGFVKIAGEDGGSRKDPGSFTAKSYGRRALVLVAGVTMNILLATLLFSLGYKIGAPQIIDGEIQGNMKNPKIQILEITADSPAADAGFQVGDILRKINNQDISEVSETQKAIAGQAGKETDFFVARGKELLTLKAIPRSKFSPGDGPLGLGLVKTAIISYSLPRAIKEGCLDTAYALKLITTTFYHLLADMIISGKVSADLSGPIGVAVMTSRASQMGFVYLLQFTALLSVNLAIINILPIPALDGGRLLFLAIESIRRRPLNQKVEQWVNTAGFAGLIILMLLVTFRDVFRFGLVSKIGNLF